MSEGFGPYRFTLTKEEFLAYAQEVGRRQLVAMDAKSWRLSAFAAAAVSAVLMGLLASHTLDPATLMNLAVACVLAILVGRFFIRRQIVRAQNSAIAQLAEERSAFAKEVTLALDEEGVSIEMGGESDARPFRELRQIARLSGMIVFWAGPNDGLALPERAIPSPQEAEAAFTFAKERVVGA